MKTLTVGDFVFIKATGENGVVYAPPVQVDSRLMEVVRVPQPTKEGPTIYDKTFMFLREELETAEERIARQVELQVYELEIRTEAQAAFAERQERLSNVLAMPERPN